MWPLDYFRNRKYQRHYKAALLVYLGAYAIARLNAVDRARVNEEFDSNFNKSFAGPAATIRRFGSWDLVAASRAAAMHRLGIHLDIPGVAWDDLFAPWKDVADPYFAFRTEDWDWRPYSLINDFHPMGQAALNAKTLLRKHGIDVPEADPWNPRDLLSEEQIRRLREVQQGSS